VWNYIKAQNIELPSLYFAHKRSVFERKGVLMPTTPLIKRLPHEIPQEHWVRFRTVGDMSCTAAVASMAKDIDTVIQEISGATISERGARMDDQRSEGAMEERKKAGYF
jgi:sulfate adenylyltransferase subunit 2